MNAGKYDETNLVHHDNGTYNNCKKNLAIVDKATNA